MLPDSFGAPAVAAEAVRVESADGGAVKRSRTVRSWVEHDAAVGAACGVPGVSKVEGDLLVIE